MKTRSILVLCVILIIHLSAKSQVKIGNNATTINSASILELETTNKGFVLPRVALTDVSSSSPLPSGLLKGTVVYDSVSTTTGGSGAGIYYWDGNSWNFLANTTITGSYWSLTGNSGTNASSNFIGTTDAKDFVVRTNNTERMRILGATNGSSQAGWIGMGIATTPKSALDVAGNYAGKNVVTIQNTSSTGYSSVDMLDNLGNLAATFGFANTGTGNFTGKAYLNGYGNDFLFTRGSSYDLLMKGSNGYVGLNTSTPSERLHVVGNIYLNGAFMPGGDAGTSGYVLTSAGANTSPTWTNTNSVTWRLAGNSGTNASTNFIGTTDAVDFVARTSNTERLRITSGGNVGIGLTNPSYKLAVLSASNPLYLSGVQATAALSTDSVLTIYNGIVKKAPFSAITGATTNTLTLSTNTLTSTVNGVATVSNAVSGVSNISSANTLSTTVNGVTGTTVSIINTNTNALTQAGGLVTTVNGVTATTNIPSGTINNVLGYNSSGSPVYQSLSGLTLSTAWNITGNSGTSYANHFLGTTDNVSMRFRTNNAQRMIIDSLGRVGVGTNSPSEKLDVSGNLRFSGALMPNNAPGTAGFFLMSSGANNPPTWFDASNYAWQLDGNPVTTVKKFGTTTNYDIPFITNNVERMRLTSGGLLGIGTTNPGNALSILAASDPLYLSGVQATSTFSTDSVLTINAGVVKKTPYSSLTAISWNLLGNIGTNSAINFLGTTDNHPLKFQVNSVLSGLIDSSGGSGSSFFGYGSGSSITTGSHNTATGYQALYSATTANNNTAYGYQALFNNTGTGNTAAGYSSMYSNTTGQYNTAYGFAALNSNTSGSYNVAVGQSALQHNTTGANNAVVGEDGLLNNTTGRYLAGLGTNVLYSNTTGSYNTAVGESTLYTNTTGAYNIAMGSYTLFNNTTASNNIAFGYYAGNLTTTGGNNIFIGSQSGSANTTGSYNVLIGTNSNVLSAALTNASAIGYNSKVGLSNSLVLGDTTTGGYAVNVGIGVRNPLKRLHIDAAPVGSSSASDSLKIDHLASSNSAYNKAVMVIDSATGYVTRQSINTLAANNYWSLTGNSGTNYATNFLGTTDNVSLHFRTNNTEQMILDSLGNLSVGYYGASSFNPGNPPRLSVDYGTTTSNTIAYMRGSIDSYLQMNLRNKSNGTNASTDYVATADDGTDSTYYVDLGINSSNYAPSVDNFGGPHDAYLYSAARNLLIGTEGSNSDVVFLLGGGRTKYDAVLRMDGTTGNIVIGKGDNNSNATGNIIRGPNAGGTNVIGGSLTLRGGAGTGTAQGGNIYLYGGNTGSGSRGSVNINVDSSSATNINTGVSAADVTIGNASNNVNFPKLSATSVVLTDASKNLASITPTSNTYLYYNGTNFTWSAATTLGSFSATAPLTYNSATGVFGINQATTSTNGYLSSTDWNTFNNKVGSITLNTPSSVFSNPVNFSVSSGAATGTLSLNTQTANTVFAGPATGVAAAPTFRSLVAADIPSLAASYIQNQTTQQASSNFNISGSGTIGTNLSVTGTSTLTGAVTSKAGISNTGALTSSGGITNINASSNYATNINTGTSTGTITLGNSANNILLPKFNTTGGIIYTSASTGQIASTGANITWDNVNNRLGIGITSPSYKLSVLSASDPLYLSGVQATAAFSTDSILTIYNGVVKKAPTSSLANVNWSLTGNSGTSASTNFIGTTDAVDFIAKTNNTERMRITSAGLVGIGTNNPASDLTIFQSSGSGSSKGITFTGNSISGTGSGTGFLMSLGYNTAGNKQLWLGDGDYAGNASGSFARFVTTGTVFPVFDAVSGDGASRRYLALGVAGDANSGVIFGADNTSVNPGSQVWDNGNMSIGSGYKSYGAPSNGLLVQGNVGIGTTSPSSALSVLAASNPLYLSGVQATSTFSSDSILTINAGVVKKVAYTSLSGAGNWSITGNSGTTAGTNFIGTTSASDFVTKTNSTERMRITSAGLVGIGVTTPQQALSIGNGLNIDQNSSNTGSTTNALTFGSSSGEGIGSKRSASGNQYGLDFYTAYNNRMAITNTGNVGIATTTPGSTLDVKGTFRLSGSSSGYVGLKPAAAAGSTTYTLPAADGSANQVLSTDGSGNLAWANAVTSSSLSSTPYDPTTDLGGTYTEIGETAVSVTSGDVLMTSGFFSAKSTDNNIVMRVTRSTTAGSADVGTAIAYSASSLGSSNKYFSVAITNTESGVAAGTWYYKLWATSVNASTENYNLTVTKVH